MDLGFPPWNCTVASISVERRDDQGDCKIPGFSLHILIAFLFRHPTQRWALCFRMLCTIRGDMCAYAFFIPHHCHTRSTTIAQRTYDALTTAKKGRQPWAIQVLGTKQHLITHMQMLVIASVVCIDLIYWDRPLGIKGDQSR